MAIHNYLSISLLTILFLGCPVERPEESLSDPGHDWDADGFCENAPCMGAAQGGDCNDDDPNVYPGADEGCDGLDTDCDGALGPAEGDGDGDDFMVCQGDCNDEDPAVHPGADEQCNGHDDDCDGSPDADEVDDDGDGVMACEDDCDDEDADVFPGAEEVCNGEDDDCDGDVDEGHDGDGDGFTTCGADGILDTEDDDCDDGNPLLNLADTDADGWTTCEGDCDDDEALANPATAEVCNDWIDNDCDGTANGCGMHGEIDLSLADAKLTGESSGDQAGIAVAGGDVDGDGFSDVLVGAWYDATGGTDAGAVYVVYGPVTGDMGLALADAKLIGEASADYAGRSLSCAGDVDGDGNDDILVGAYGVDDAGAAYLLYGPVSGNLDLSGADAKFVGETAGDAVGFSVSGAGDVNADGYADIIVGAHMEDEGGESAGAAYLLHGPLYGTISLDTATAKLVGEEADDKAGVSVSGAGDVDGDGYDDILIGAYQNGTGEAGKTYMVYGPVSSTVDLGSADAILLGEAGDDGAGISVSTAGDVDGDGYDDVLVGAYAHDAGGSNAGVAYLLHGPIYGSIELSLADTTFIGEVAGDYAGYTVSAGGDLNGDGLDDIVVGAKRESTGGYRAGAAYLLYSSAPGDVDLSLADAKAIGEVTEDSAGYAIAPAGDVDGDGYDDLLVGALGHESGAAYLMLGGGI